jgi:glyoxylase-like metal-dependent hydrolase (beta-lactamase superfamily II)
MRYLMNSLRPFFLALSFGLLAVATPLSGQSERKVAKLADGVYEIQHPNAGGNVNGNTTIIIGERQVFVVDTCYLPSVAREDIAQIRQWTDRPVSFVLNTHFHNDHNLGNRAYMDAFPALTIIAHAETKKEMDLFGPGSAMRDQRDVAYLQKMLETGKTPDGQTLSEADKTQVKNALARRMPALEEVKKVKFQSATLSFEHDFSLDLGNREVEIKFLGRGNTPGDAVVYLPKEKIAIAGDLLVYPIPYIYDGYPREWIQTLQNLAQLDADMIVPGHGPVMHDKTYIYLMRDLMKSAVDQMTESLRKSRPAMFQTLDEVKASVDLTPFRQRFAGNDKDLGEAFDEAAANLVKVVFQESSLR